MTYEEVKDKSPDELVEQLFMIGDLKRVAYHNVNAMINVRLARKVFYLNAILTIATVVGTIVAVAHFLTKC